MIEAIIFIMVLGVIFWYMMLFIVSKTCKNKKNKNVKKKSFSEKYNEILKEEILKNI